ncbi:hypothetical protein BTZ20_3852 [Rhodococcus sp. MTM3W5.2]|nr:hypothetical protein BTZ20_3852 [Rhodococcus sp. MTM3W5.2]
MEFVGSVAGIAQMVIGTILANTGSGVPAPAGEPTPGFGSRARAEPGCHTIPRSVPGVVMPDHLLTGADALAFEVSVRGRGAEPSTERIVRIEAVRAHRTGRRGFEGLIRAG